MALCIAPSVVLIALALQCQVGTAFAWHEGTIEGAGSWDGDDWDGDQYTMEYSYDGSMLLLVGYGGPNEVRVLDRDMGLLGRWVPAGPDLSVEGACWSTSDLSVTLWGANGTGGNDTLLVLSVPDLEPMEGFNLTAANALVDVTTARLLVEDFIIAVGGRDGTGASRLLVLEVATSHLISDIGWKENATIVALENDGIDLIIIDDRGFVSTIETMTWTVDTRWEGPGGPPSARSIGSFAGNRICIVGYGNGKVRVWEGYPRDLNAEADAGAGPVTGVASLFPDPRFYAIAVPKDGGGSRISGWIHNASLGEKEWSNIIEAPAGVLSMDADPQVAGQFLAAFDDGTVFSYRTSIILDQPPYINITDPPREAEWKGVMTVRGEVVDDVGRVDWVRYSIDGGEWMDANGTDRFSIVIDIDALALQPATHSITFKTFDGVNEYEMLYDFHIQKPPTDDEGKYFWYWFVGCTSLVVVVLIALYLARPRGKGPSPPSAEGGEGSNGTEEGTGMERDEREEGPGG